MRELLVVLALLWCSAAHADEPIGYVLSAEPSAGWTVTYGMETRGIDGGQQIEAGAVLHCGDDSGVLSLVLTGLDAPIECPADPRCAGPMQPAAPAASLTDRLAIALARFIQHSERYAPTLSRGHGELADAVVCRRGRSVDLGPGLAGTEAGWLDLSLAPVVAAGTSEAVPFDASLHWRPGSRGIVRVAGIGDGPYDLVVSSGERVRVAVLSRSCRRTQAALDDVTRTLDSWGLDDRTSRQIRRAWLDAAAE
jgi:hypothetical protein